MSLVFGRFAGIIVTVVLLRRNTILNVGLFMYILFYKTLLSVIFLFMFANGY